MAITMQDVRAWLDPDEPDYAGAARSLGPAALPLLLELVRGGDLGLASKATSLASRIPSDKSVDVLAAAAATAEPILRVAAAGALHHLKPAHAERLLAALETDPDPGVRKVMVKSAAQVKSPRAATLLKQMSAADPEPFVREKAVGELATVAAAAARSKSPKKSAARKTAVKKVTAKKGITKKGITKKGITKKGGAKSANAKGPRKK
jgi:HEAT repeat protein